MTEDETRPRRHEQFRQAQKMEAMGRLAAGVAHDLNNILGVILGHCEILNLQFQSPNPRAKHIQEIDKAAQRAAALTRRLLAFSREQIIQPKLSISMPSLMTCDGCYPA